MQLRTTDPDDGHDLAQRTGALASETMAALDVAPSDAVGVEGDSRTVVRVVPSDRVERGRIALSEVDRENAGVGTGDPVAVDPVTLPTADAVTVRVTDRVDVRGAEEAVRRVLGGSPVAAGDRCRLSAPDESVALSASVESVAPDSPAWVDADTAVAVTRVASRSGDPAFATNVRPADVGGLESQRRRLRRLVEVGLERADIPDDRRRALGGVLLYGPPGTGKTRLATAVGTAADAQFLPVTVASEFYDGTVAVGDVLEAVEAASATVVFFDDIDAMTPAQAGDDRARSTAELAAALDALVDRPDVVVLAATTDPDAVDATLRRGGPLDHEVAVGTPDRADRAEILTALVRDISTNDVDVERVAERTPGFVGADLRELVSAALDRAARREPDGPAGPTTGDFVRALDAVEPSGLRHVRVEQPETTYADIGGLEAVKRELVRTVEWPVQYPELFDRALPDPPSGVLLYGPPGTGKTTLARAVAASTDANVLAVDGPELFDRYVGESERAVRRVFEAARTNAPAVVFFDELDALASRRGASGSGDPADRVVGQLLTAIDGVDPASDVVVVGATNRPEVVDLSATEDYEQRIEELTERVEAQQAEIEELRDLLLDLSVRQADDRGMGVCPECHGPVEKVRRWFRPTVIKCRRCGEVFHES